MENPSAKKASRLNDIELLLLAHPEGLRPAEIARRIGVNRSTVTRYYSDLPKHIYVDTDGTWKVDREAYLVNVRFSLHEAVIVHLAARLLATRLDRQNPHAAAALRKLGNALDRLAPQISQHILQSAEVMETAATRHDPRYLQVLKTLSLGWAEGRKVRVWHCSEPGGRVFSYTFAPYFIEPYAVGQSTHIIGLREPPGALRTFKLERIERAELLGERYKIPKSFDPRVLLADAWGIWYTEAEPVEIVLRFSRQVADRVKESQWHTSEQVETQADGSLIWRARIAEPKELLPWIRGWGAQVEVIAPDSIRRSLVEEAQQLFRVYHQNAVEPTPLYKQLWAKADQKTEAMHPLLFHLIDCGWVALALWKYSFGEKLRQTLAGFVGLDQEAAGRLFAFWVGLHDLGKASPAFQRKFYPAEAHLKTMGLSFPDPTSFTAEPHGLVSAWALPSYLKSDNLSDWEVKLLARALGGHHGMWPTDHQYRSPNRMPNLGGDHWKIIRDQIVERLKAVFQPPEVKQFPQEGIDQNIFLTVLSGWTSTADWISSMEVHFPYESSQTPEAQYALRAEEQAAAAVHRLGWAGWQPDGQSKSFEEMFPFPPRPVQSAAIQAVQGVELPALAIVEASTGSGKTETALYIADQWLQASGGRGIYIAMPTQATSNQMFRRAKDFLARRYPSDLINIQLAHGQTLLSEDVQPLLLSSIDEDIQGSVRSMTWFLPKKRVLLAPFGVGTVDQTFLSVLQTRHFFVRLFGLQQKVVIFDEVHAYDVYMAELFWRLLEWLRAIGASVIILSATLPEQTRRRLAQAFGARLDNSEATTGFPRLMTVSSGRASICPLPAEASRTISLARLGRSAAEIAAFLQERLKKGGCAAVICNTIGRSQQVYEAVRDAEIVPPDRLLLFHARFPYGWRHEREDQVIEWFGKQGQRPEKAIVVATQVIEQSLDLDFDLIISDLAPIDLLIQRAGRLHRHAGRARPDGLTDPIFGITETGHEPHETADFGPDGFVYEPYILLRSQSVLAGREVIRLPEETTQLIEYVYGENNTELSTAEGKAWNEMEKRRRKSIHNARTRLTLPPQDEELLTRQNLNLEEDAPQVHSDLQALTREGPPGVHLVCLHALPNGQSCFDPDSPDQTADLNCEPNGQLTKAYLKNSVQIQHYDLVRHFMAQPQPAAWKMTAALRRHYPVTFKNGRVKLEGIPYTLLLDKELGLRIRKETA